MDTMTLGHPGAANFAALAFRRCQNWSPPDVDEHDPVPDLRPGRRVAASGLGPGPPRPFSRRTPSCATGIRAGSLP